MTFLFIFEFLGTSETMLILVAALLLFGPRKLPQLSRTIGKSIADFKRASQEFKDTWENEVTREVNDFQTVISSTALPDATTPAVDASIQYGNQPRAGQSDAALAESQSLLLPAPVAVSGADAHAGDFLFGNNPLASPAETAAPNAAQGSAVAVSNHKRDWL